jgi:hypothetical protein
MYRIKIGIDVMPYCRADICFKKWNIKSVVQIKVWLKQ